MAGVTSVDFDEFKFEDIEESDLFWFKNNSAGDDNPAFRKRSNSSALNTRNRTISENISSKKIVYQKT